MEGYFAAEFVWWIFVFSMNLWEIYAFRNFKEILCYRDFTMNNVYIERWKFQIKNAENFVT